MVLFWQTSFSWHFGCDIKVISSPLTPSTNLKLSVLCIIGYNWSYVSLKKASVRLQWVQVFQKGTNIWRGEKGNGNPVLYFQVDFQVLQHMDA